MSPRHVASMVASFSLTWIVGATFGLLAALVVWCLICAVGWVAYQEGW